LTVFTPTYNRAHTLGACYRSLLRQTSRDFTWLVIDDGSTDGTRELVKGWIFEGLIHIAYHYQPNQGMHGAHNAAYRLIRTELNVCVDSDDYLADNAVELIVDKWRREGGERYAGIVALDATTDGTLIGTRFRVPATTLGDFYRRGGKGDKKLIYRTDIITAVPEYPLFGGEKYVGLGYKYQLVDLNYQMLTMNEIVCHVDYLPEGSSRGMYRQYFQNPRGFAFIRRESMKHHPSPVRRLVEAVHYVSSSIICRNGRFLAESPRKLMTLLAILPGVLLWTYLCIQYRRGRAMKV
jgi:glycosyltransferase involved in cell wall biosynthesis